MDDSLRHRTEFVIMQFVSPHLNIKERSLPWLIRLCTKTENTGEFVSSCTSSFANNRLLYTGVKNQMVAVMRHVDAPAQGLLASLVQDINLSLGMEGHTQRQFAE